MKSIQYYLISVSTENAQKTENDYYRGIVNCKRFYPKSLEAATDPWGVHVDRVEIKVRKSS